ncbi:MAG: cob(I)yrinic acid a,c-diamide adenosyltransferase [Phycisphaerae bacterium]
MVKLNKIYTKTGDDGTTGLVGGARVAKDDPRVEAYGTVDEANSQIGMAIVIATGGLGVPASNPRVAARIGEVLSAIPNDLFDVGAVLATPVAQGETAGAALRVTAEQVEKLEQWIDEFNERLEPLNSFVLPGGTPLAGALHVARTVARRAERAAVTLRAEDEKASSPESVRYLNRLSDLLFVLARVANDDGRTDVLWQPGAGRKK